MECRLGMALKHGPMAPSTQASLGTEIFIKGRLLGLIEQPILESSETTDLAAMERWCIQTGKSMRENFEMASLMAKEPSHTQTEANTSVRSEVAGLRARGIHPALRLLISLVGY